MKKQIALLLAVMLLTLSACASTNNSPQTDDPAQTDTSGADDEIQYDYQLKAGETIEVYDVTFEEMVTVTRE